MICYIELYEIVAFLPFSNSPCLSYAKFKNVAEKIKRGVCVCVYLEIIFLDPVKLAEVGSLIYFLVNYLKALDILTSELYRYISQLSVHHTGTQ